MREREREVGAVPPRDREREREILVMASKQYADKHVEYKSEFAGAPSRGPIAFYACKANRAVARAALMFQQQEPGCSTRAITWFCPDMS